MRHWRSVRRWTCRALSAMAVAAGCAVTAAAQQSAGATGQGGTVVGQVLNVESKVPLPDAIALVKGTQLGGDANADGRYVIRNVPAGPQTIRVQLLGFAPVEHTVTVVAGQTVTVNFELKEVPYTMGQVVVTALGIERKEKSLGYAVQSISAEQLAKVPEPTMMQALAGQSAGVKVTSASGRPGAGARITIRGETSFSGNGQPLFVIDGVPVSTDIAGPSDPLGTGSAGSRQMDFDMANVEKLTVLRGAAATALYGSRAANGAIIITTKQGRFGQPLRFNLSTDLRFDRPILDGYVENWAAGDDGYFCNGRLPEDGGWCEPGHPGTRTYTQNNWGPNIDSLPQIVLDSVGPVRFRDPRADFYKLALTSNNALRASGGMGDFGNYSLGVSYLDQNGVNPVEKLNRLSLNGNVSIKWSDRLQSRTMIERIRSENPYSAGSYNGIDHLLLNLPPSTDIRQGYHPDGTPVMLGPSSPSIQWLIDNEYNTETTNRWVASQQLRLTIAPGLYLSNNLGLDTYVSEFGQFANERPWRTAQGRTSGSTSQRKTTFTSINNDLQLIMDSKSLGNSGVSISGLIGGNLLSRDGSYVNGSGSEIVIPDYYNLSNFVNQRVRANLPTQRRLLGAYTSITAGYKDWAFLTLTGRNDWSSTLPTNANSYFYPSAQLAVVFTDALNWHPGWLDYGKLRISKTKVGNDAPAYSLSTTYRTASAQGANNGVNQFGGPSIDFPFRGITAFTPSTQLGNPELKPESTTEDEIGLELRFFGGRARADISAYRKLSYDQIFDVPSSSVTGYTSIERNAGDLKNKGLEVSLGGRPIQIGSFSWDLNLNWSTNKSKVLSLAPGVTSLYLAGYSWPQIRIMEDQPYGVIWGYGWARNCVADNPCFQDAEQGAVLIGDDGLPVLSTELGNLGTVMPNWLGSISTEFHFKNFGLSALLDMRNGGHIINFQTQYEVGNGRSIFTADRYTWTVEKGVNINTGKPNTVRVFKDRDYYNAIYGFDRHESQIEPAGFTKLREVSLSYTLPKRLTEWMNVQGATFFVTGRNLGVWSDFSLGDPEGDVYGGQNAGGQYFRQYSEPQTRSFLVGLRSIF